MVRICYRTTIRIIYLDKTSKNTEYVFKELVDVAYATRLKFYSIK